MSRTGRETIAEALAHLSLVERYASGDLEDQLVIDALCMRLSAGIEVLARLDAVTRANMFGDDWPLMWGMRNRIAHGYLLVEPDIVRQTVAIDVPLMLQVLRTAAAEPPTSM